MSSGLGTSLGTGLQFLFFLGSWGKKLAGEESMTIKMDTLVNRTNSRTEESTGGVVEVEVG